MNSKKEALLYGIIGLLFGSLITLTIAVYAINHPNSGMMNAMGLHTTSQQLGDDMNMPGMSQGSR